MLNPTSAPLARMPKVELHLHLDCSLSFELVSRLDPTVTRERYAHEFIAPPKCTSLADFLTRAPRGFQLMQTREALRLTVLDLFEQLARDGVIYAEIRYAPLLHLELGLTAEQVVATVDRATEEAIAASGIEARLILCTLRHYSEAQSLETVKLVERFRGSRVVALDIAADEAGFGIEAHIPAFRYAIDHGLHRTAHAGEARGADSVWETLRHFEPTRIGHGVRSIEDPVLVAHLREHGIHLEVCPSSNVQTCVCDSLASHPLDRLYRAGVSLGLSTDARTITNVTLTQEYERVQAAFGWTESDLRQCNQAALRAAFVEDDVKRRLLAKIGG